MNKYQTFGKGAIVILIWNGFSALATVYDSDGSSTKVQFIHDTLAQDGDTITLPSGTFTWTSAVSIGKAITLQGAGIGTTIVKDDVQNPNRLLSYTLVAGKPSRLTGIEFQDGGRAQTASEPQGFLGFDGDNTSGATIRVDHCRFNNVNGTICPDTVIGVFDHDDFVLRTPGVSIRDSAWNGDSLRKGDVSWAAPTNFGSGQFLFIEDCTATIAPGVSNTKGLTDAVAGARFVVRHCTLNNATVQTHGTESTGRSRSSRALEIYNNTFNMTLSNSIGGIRGGIAIMHDNIYLGAGIGTETLTCFRMSSGDYPWWAADGTDAWDINDPFVYDSGTVSAAGNLTMTDSSESWILNQWVGYTARKTGQPPGYTGSEIVSNTSNTLTIKAGHDYSMQFAAGDNYEIRKVIQALDSSGRARGSLISGAPPTLPLGWNDQVTEPCYSWNNTSLQFVSDTSVVRQGEHFLNGIPMPGYTPYTYPHPLTTGGNPSPTPTPSPNPTPTATPTATATPTSTPTSTSTPTPTPTATATPTPTSTPTSTPTATATATSTPGQITLTARGYLVNGRRRADLSWSGATSNRVDVYRSGALIATTGNNGFYTDRIGGRPPGTFTYQVCNTGTNTCSNQATVTF